ncbi:hypothetical protein MTR67_039792 [Solanum verrucosum]|uniref:SWIM-type domain-containing protein n=1 Tax=Solanum verrucosum TaxID=315347 RepID=A0AAF0UI36_SOLVR|nr:hypothetical protein MTR67_039792 [Solanum verrucosum]
MPIIKMLEEIRLKVMRRLVSNEAKVRSWKGDFSPLCMKLYIVYRAIAHGCKVEFNGDFVYEVTKNDDRHIINPKDKRCTCRAWELSGIPCPHAIKAMLYEKVEPGTQIRWYYFKEAYLLTYKNKIQPVRAVKFWKVDPAQAMEPPEVVKTIGRPKLTRDRVPDEAGKRNGEWSQSRKGSTMHCKKYGEPNHNTRGCFNDNTQGASSSSRNCIKKCNDTISTPRAHHSGGTNDEAEIEFQTEMGTNQSVYSTTQPYGPEVGTEEDPSLGQWLFMKSQGWRRERKKPKPSIGSRRIGFTGDASGVSIPINLPYSPTKTIWKGKA